MIQIIPTKSATGKWTAIASIASIASIAFWILGAGTLLWTAPASGAAGTSAARENSAAAPAASAIPTSRQPASATALWNQTHRVSKIIGTDVRNVQGQEIGAVIDVILDTQGTVGYLVVSTGGFIGIGDRLHAIPWKAFRTDRIYYYVLDIDKERLKQAPAFESKDWPQMAEERWTDDVRRFYQVNR